MQTVDDNNYTNNMMITLITFISCALLTGVVTTFSPRLERESENYLRFNYLSNQDDGNYILIDATKITNSKVDNKPLERFKRSAVGSNSLVNQVNLNDTHGLLLVSWTGEGSDVIIALAKDPVVTVNYSSNFYLSHDYGTTFKKQSILLENGLEAAVHWFYVSPVVNTHYVITDIIHKTLWTTSDSGRTFNRKSLSFIPLHVSFHPSEWETLVAFENKGNSFDIHISLNFGATWMSLHNGAMNFFWGSMKYGDNTSDVYIHDTTRSYALKYNYVTKRSIQLLSDVHSFQRTNEFLMAIKKVYKPSLSANVSELWVSTNNRDFRKAKLPGNNYYKDMYVVDATEHQIFLCASINDTKQVNLYTSGVNGLHFSLSLEGLIYYNPTGINGDTWLRLFVSRQFADLHKVEGLNGVYIANKLTNTPTPPKDFTNTNQVTTISFNKGGDWRYLPAPTNRTDFYCLFSSNCNLHLTQIFHSLLPFSTIQPIVSTRAAPGLIVATGNTGSSINTTLNTFISGNGGFSWRKVLNGTYHIVIGDHGGIIVAIQKDQLTNYIIYSVDEGHSWSTLEFNQNKIRVYGLFTEPGEEMGVFTIFGSNVEKHSWIVLQINLTKAFGRTCNDSDYTTWIPTSDPSIDCLLGRKMTFEKRRPFALCYNGRNYDREISVENCPCKIEDYECDFGFTKNLTTKLCQLVETPPSPNLCFEGNLYNRTRGYRRVPMDTCEGGMENDFEPLLSNCPVRALGEFVMFTNMTSIHRYSFSTRRSVKIQTRNVENIVATSYDYRNDCLYFADNKQDDIQVMCLRGTTWGNSQRVIIKENMEQIESMSFNWVTRQLFWVDSGHKRVECLNLKNNKRIIIMNGLDEPKSLAIHPKKGFMFISDWSASNPRIIRSNMIGSDQLIIINRTKFSTLKWPNGMSLDLITSRLYFVDAGVNRLYHCNFQGESCNTIELPIGAHPFSTTIFKQNVLWADPMAGAIYSVSKQRGGVSMKLIEGFQNIVGLNAFSISMQLDISSCSSNPCGDVNSFCFELNETSSTCKCSDEFLENNNGGRFTCDCRSGTTLSGNSCVTSASSRCPGDQFTCSNLRCVPMSDVCDGNNDCSDYSDEWNCTSRCVVGQFQCMNGRCIPQRWICDGDNDCRDMSDENPDICHMKNCSENEFRCASGRCILSRYICDGDDDCLDGSDEVNCSYVTTTIAPIQCNSTQFKCLSGTQCIPLSYKCDSGRDCLDGSDETNCTSVEKCPEWHSSCSSKDQCVLSWKFCDGNVDCNDGSDEKDCLFSRAPSATPPPQPTHCLSEEFQCRSLGRIQCIPLHEVCDGVSNCLDQSDEASCSNCLAPMRFRCANGGCVNHNLVCNHVNDCGDNSDEMTCHASTPHPFICPSPSIRCSGDNKCIPDAWVCDGEKDCMDGADEVGCQNVTVSCGENTFSCFFSKFCINESLVCDGHDDCPGGDEEIHCEVTPPRTCTSSEFRCELGGCVDEWVVCDGRWNCADASDEKNCGISKLNIIPILLLVNISYNSVTFQITKLNDTIPRGARFNVAVTIGTTDWSYYQGNNSLTISQSELPVNLIMNKLRPNTGYIITTTITVNASSSSPVAFSFTTPARGIYQPNPPEGVTVSNYYMNDTYYLLVNWSPPLNIMPKDIFSYKIKYKEMSADDSEVHASPREVQVFGESSFVFSERELILGQNYEIQVFAQSMRWSEGSEITKIQFGTSCIDVRIPLSLSLEWTSFVYKVEDAPSAFSTSAYLQWNVTAGLEVYTYTITVRCLVSYADEDGEDVYGDFDDDAGNGAPFRVFKSEEAMTEECRKGFQCFAIVSGLSPGSSYLFRVTAESKDMSIYPTCHNRDLVYLTPGKRLKSPNIVISQLPDGKINMEFRQGDDNDALPWDSEAKIKVFHRNVNSQQFKSKYFIFRTNSQNRYDFQLGRLPSCERYCFYALLIWPMRSSLSRPYCMDIAQGNDPLEAPKNIQILSWWLDVNRTFVSATIAWSPPCLPHPMDYLVYVQLVNNEQVSLINGFSKSDPDGSSMITFTINKLLRGNHYKISVKKDISNARLSDVVELIAKPYPSPVNLTFELFQVTDVSLILTWEDPYDDDLPLHYEYEVFYSSSYLLTHDQSSFILFERTNQKFLLIANKLQLNSDHSFMVRLRCPDSGMKSNFSNIINVHLKTLLTSDQSDGGNSNKSEWKILVYVVVSAAGLCIISLLVVYVYRYSRLRRSFDSYVATRFNSESSRAIFSQLGDDDDDQPLLNRFSDDDPLIEA